MLRKRYCLIFKYVTMTSIYIFHSFIALLPFTEFYHTALGKQFQIIPSQIQSQESTAWFLSSAPTTCYKYLQQIERKGCSRFLQADEKTWRLLFVTSTECEYNSLNTYFLYSLSKIILWYTPTVLLSLMISFLTFKLPAYKRLEALLFVSSKLFQRVACNG